MAAKADAAIDRTGPVEARLAEVQRWLAGAPDSN